MTEEQKNPHDVILETLRDLDATGEGHGTNSLAYHVTTALKIAGFVIGKAVGDVDVRSTIHAKFKPFSGGQGISIKADRVADMATDAIHDRGFVVVRLSEPPETPNHGLRWEDVSLNDLHARIKPIMAYSGNKAIGWIGRGYCTYRWNMNVPVPNTNLQGGDEQDLDVAKRRIEQSWIAVMDSYGLRPKDGDS